MKINSNYSSILSSIGAFYIGGYVLGTIYGLAKRSKVNYGLYLGNNAIVGGIIGLGILKMVIKKK